MKLCLRDMNTKILKLTLLMVMLLHNIGVSSVFASPPTSQLLPSYVIEGRGNFPRTPVVALDQDGIALSLWRIYIKCAGLWYTGPYGLPNN